MKSLPLQDLQHQKNYKFVAAATAIVQKFCVVGIATLNLWRALWVENVKLHVIRRSNPILAQKF